MRARLLAVVFVLVGGAHAVAQGHLGRVDWVKDPAAGLQKAKSENRAAMLFFTAEW